MEHGDAYEKLTRMQRIERAKAIIQEKQQSLSVRPFRRDGYVNVLNRYGTSKDSSEAYEFVQEPVVPDTTLTVQYEDNGIFAKIIDTPADEALKHGFELNINNKDLDTFVKKSLDALEFEEKAATAIKWARLYGAPSSSCWSMTGGGSKSHWTGTTSAALTSSGSTRERWSSRTMPASTLTTR